MPSNKDFFEYIQNTSITNPITNLPLKLPYNDMKKEEELLQESWDGSQSVPLYKETFKDRLIFDFSPISLRGKKVRVKYARSDVLQIYDLETRRIAAFCREVILENAEFGETNNGNVQIVGTIIAPRNHTKFKHFVEFNKYSGLYKAHYAHLCEKCQDKIHVKEAKKVRFRYNGIWIV